MKLRAILFGLVPAALIATGVFWVIRTPQTPPTIEKSLRHDRGGRAAVPAEEDSEEKRLLAVVLDPGAHWEERVQSLRSLPYSLEDSSLDQLFAYLGEAPPKGQEEWYLICNEIMEVVRKRNFAPGAYTRKHLELIRSPHADPMIRDYASQHLSQWISGIDPAAMERDRDAALDAFDGILAEATRTENGALTFAGTAVSSLADAVITGSEDLHSRRDELATACLAMTADESFAVANRASALQAAARLRADGLADLCRSLLGNQETPVDLHLSAIAGLGLVGGPEDIEFLRPYADDEALKYAAAGALRRLQDR